MFFHSVYMSVPEGMCAQHCFTFAVHRKVFIKGGVMGFKLARIKWNEFKCKVN